jgi:aminoglycoside/choline kinase family phosphotransferase
MEKLTALYVKWRGEEPAKTELLPASGSNRRYTRFTDSQGGTVIGAVGTSKEENHAFVYLAQHFTMRKLPVPRILAVSDDGMRYLQTDLGHRSLFDALAGGRAAGGRYNEDERRLLRSTIAQLPNLQVRGARGLDFSNCYPQASLDKTNVLFDLNYFKYCFLKATGLDFHELKLEANFQLMATDLTSGEDESFLYRDFQARNVMLSDADEPYFIDFQGGRRGPVQYDVASFLWQASAQYSPQLRNELIDVYLDNLKQYTEVKEADFRKQLQRFVLFRTLQVLGAYGFRGYFERKEHFLKSIPPAMVNLRALLTEEACPYPYLRDTLTRLAALPRFAPVEPKPAPRKDGFKTTDSPIYRVHAQDGLPTYSKYDGRGPLVVRVYSFSYQKGIPADESGNGGGYVFDCRSTHNPGRYEPYKQLTGLDEPVIRFLEDDGEILKFLDDVYRLADRHVERYIQRGFTDLMFCFGCTGGQHRSVYSAQHLAEHINKKYGIEVRICHRERGIETILKSK